MKHAARRWVPVATVLLLGLWSSACGSHASFQHTPFPGIERYSEDGDFAAALDTQIVLPRQPRASVLWLDQSTQWPAPLSDGDRQRLLDDLQRALSGPPFAAVSVIPTTDPTTADSQVELLEVRSAAAHLQSDVAIIVMTNTQVAREWNPLAVTYLAVVTGLIVPGDDLYADVAAQACAIDVRTGLFLDCAQSHAEDVDRFVVPAWRASAQRALAASTTERALADLPERLRGRVIARLADARSASTAGVAQRPVGIPYVNRDRLAQ